MAEPLQEILSDLPLGACFQRIARMAAHFFGAPASVVAFPLPGGAFGLESYGIDPAMARLDLDLCLFAAGSAAPVVVEDTQRVDGLADTPLAVGNRPVRFYAGCSLPASNDLPEGGVLSILDVRRRRLSVAQRQYLADFVGLVGSEIERRSLRLALAQSEERWRKLVDHHPEAVVISSEGRIVYVNRTAVDLYGGASAEDLIGRGGHEYIWQDQFELLDQRRASLARGEAVPLVRFRVKRPDGEEQFVESVSVPIIFEGKQAHLAIVRDVTDRLRYEQQLIDAKEHAEEMDRLKSAFLANMSHEIRTPLTSIIGFSDVLAEEVTGHSREFLQLINKNGRRLLETLNSVLDLAQLQGGDVRLHPERIDVVARVAESAELLRPRALDVGLTLECEASSPYIEATLDRTALDRVLFNLLANAIKFTHEGGIVVSTEALNGRVRIRVKDTGIGMDAEFLPHVFNEFRQESIGFGRGYEGSGLGLNITKRLVEMMGGEITVESTKGVGTVFTVVLPLEMPGHPAHTLP